MSTSYNNVFFLAAARMAGQGIIVASYSYNTETELGAVKQVLEQPNSMTPGKHYSFNVGQLSWHLISGMPYVLVLRLTPSSSRRERYKTRQ
jgi:hypothetical protein